MGGGTPHPTPFRTSTASLLIFSLGTPAGQLPRISAAALEDLTDREKRRKHAEKVLALVVY